MINQTLRGLVGQSMSGRKASITPRTYLYPPGSYSFSPPEPGRWRFVLWGPGSGSVGGTIAGASGAYSEFSTQLAVSDAIALVVGSGLSSGAQTSTTAVFPGGKTITAGAASGVTAGVASGGDYNLDGSAGTASNSSSGGAGQGTGGGAAGAVAASSGGAGAPARLPFRGGAGGDVAASTTNGHTPGGGACQVNTVTVTGGDGLIIVMREL